MALEDVTIIDGSPVRFSSSIFVCFNQNSFCANVAEKIATFRRQTCYTDVVLQTGSVLIPRHRVVLAAASSFLHHKLMNHNAHTVQLNEICPQVIETIVDFLYTGQIKITSENVVAITKACDHLELHQQQIKTSCDKFISKQVTAANCMGLLHFAKVHELDVSLKSSHTCMLSKLKEIVQVANITEYKALSKDDLIEWITNDDLEADNEALVFDLVVK